jgi:hypothetical protein
MGLASAANLVELARNIRGNSVVSLGNATLLPALILAE